MATLKKKAATTKNPKLQPWNQNMLKLMNEISSLPGGSDTKFLDSIGFSIHNISQVKSGRQNFTHSHILAAAKTYNRSIDWIYGTSQQTELIADPSPVNLIEQGLRMLKAEKKK